MTALPNNAGQDDSEMPYTPSAPITISSTMAAVNCVEAFVGVVECPGLDVITEHPPSKMTQRTILAAPA
jgi:hypothetical protein